MTAPARHASSSTDARQVSTEIGVSKRSHRAAIADPTASTNHAVVWWRSTPTAAPARATAVIHAMHTAEGCCSTGARGGTTPPIALASIPYTPTASAAGAARRLATGVTTGTE